MPDPLGPLADWRSSREDAEERSWPRSGARSRCRKPCCLKTSVGSPLTRAIGSSSLSSTRVRRILIDRYNQLAVLDKDGDLTCVFFMSGTDIAAWLPDGTRWGHAPVISGGEPTPGARASGLLRPSSARSQTKGDRHDEFRSRSGCALRSPPALPASSSFVPTARSEIALRSVCAPGPGSHGESLRPGRRVPARARAAGDREDARSGSPPSAWLRLSISPSMPKLVPALLDDEASGMATATGGLVFLPGGRALMFDRHSPVELTEKLLSAQPRPRRKCAHFRKPRQLADRLVQIALELPGPPRKGFTRELKQPGAWPTGARSRPPPTAATPARNANRWRLPERGRTPGRGRY